MNELDAKNKVEKDNIKYIDDSKFSYILLLVAAAIIVIVVDMLYVVVNYKIIVVNYNSMLISYIIVVNIMFLIWGITNNVKISLSTTLIMSALLSVINQIKIAYMGEPIYISDVGYLNNIGEIFSIVDNTFFNTIKSYMPLTIICLTLLIVFIFKLKKAHIQIDINNRKKRLAVICLPIIILLLLFVPNKTTKKIYLNLFYNVKERKNYNWVVSTADYYLIYGVFGGIYGQFLEGTIHEPEEYSEIALNNLLIEAESNNQRELELGTPNIIVILSETFWDISKLDEVEFDKEITPNFNKLKEQGIHFEMLSPSYGGTTANVEMEFLTGFNLAYYNNGYIPYLQLYKNGKKTPNVINELKNNGYTTKIISCSGKKLFNADIVYNAFGVDETEYLKDIDNKYKKGYYVSDEYVTDKIIQELKSEKHRKFCMALTMQAHMPYELKKYDHYDISIIKSNLDKEMEDTLLSYAQGIYDADKQLGRLNDYIQTIDEPTIVIFFGDHLPYLNTANGKDVMSKLEYFNTDDKIVNNYRKYNTEAVLIANFEIKHGLTKYMSPDLIMSYILNNMDIDLSIYYKWLAQNAKILPSYNRMLATSFEGEIRAINEITKTMKQQYLLREQLQYMLFIK